LNNFKEGDTVAMSDVGRKRYVDSPDNPNNEIGTVAYDTEEGEQVDVMWLDGYNSYHIADLEIVK
jgi:hypothetical protein